MTSPSPAGAWPAISLAEAHARLTAPGAPFETETVTVRGIPVTTRKNAPPTLRELFLLGRSHGDKTFVVYEDERVSYEAFARAARPWPMRWCATACARATAWPRPCATCPSGRLPSMAHCSPAPSSRRSMHGGPAPSWNMARRLGQPRRHRRCGAHGAHRAASRRLSRAAEDLRLAQRRRAACIAGRRAGARAGVAARPGIRLAGPAALRAAGHCARAGRRRHHLLHLGDHRQTKGAIGTHRNASVVAMAGLLSPMRNFLRRGEPIPTPDPKAAQKGSLLSVPFFHVTGCMAVLNATIASGGKIVLMHRWDPVRAMGLIERERCTAAGGVPTIARQIIEHPERARFDLSSWKTSTTAVRRPRRNWYGASRKSSRLPRPASAGA